MRPRIPSRTLLVTLLAAAAVAIGGAAGAYWGGAGSGSGSGTTVTATAVTLSPGTPAASLYPGEQTSVELTVSNPNPSVVRIGSLALDTGEGVDGFAADAEHAGCDVSALGFTTQTNGGAGWDVPARQGGTDGILAVTLSDALTMGVDAADACQGASFTVYLAAGP